jgi:hypothetical protein
MDTHRSISIYTMQYNVHERRYHGGGRAYGASEYQSSHEHFHLGSANLVHQELEELRTFAPLGRNGAKNSAIDQARKGGTSAGSAIKKLTHLVRYVYLSLF